MIPARVVALAAVLLCEALTASAHAQGEADRLRDSHHAHDAQGKIASAIRDAEREVEIRRAQPDAMELAAALYDLGVYLDIGGHVERARACLEEALSIRRAATPGSPLLVAETLLALVPLLPTDAARTSAGEAYRIRREAFGEDSAQTAEARYWLAQNDQDVLEEVLRVQQRELGPDHAMIARTLRALTSEVSGKPDDNEQLSRESLAMLRRVYAADDPRIYDGLFNLARKLRTVGELQEAIDLLTEGLVIYEKQFDVHPRMISCRNGIAIMDKDLFRYEESERLMRRNLRDCRILYPDDSVQSAFVTVNLALISMYLGHCERADSLLDDASARVPALKTRGEDVAHLTHTIGAYRGRVDNWCGHYEEAEVHLQAALQRHFANGHPAGHDQIVKSYLYLGEARAGRADWKGAEAYFTQAVQSYESVRPQTGPGARPAAFQKTPYEYRALARLAMDRGEDAWLDMERARGRLLSDSLAGGGFPFTLARVQRSLAADEAIVGWIDNELPEGRPVACAYVIRSTGPVRWTRLDAGNELVFARAERYDRFRSTIVDAGYSAFSGAGEFQTDVAQSIFLERLAPLRRHLDGARTLILIPSGAMASLPVDALIDERGIFVGEAYAIRQAPSASIHAWLEERSAGAKPIARSGLLVGDPPFRAEHLSAMSRPAMETAARSRAELATLRGAVRCDPAALEALPRLPWSREEVESIAELFTASTTLVGADASRQSLARLSSSGQLGRYDVIHFATHALVDDVNPERSALVLSQLHDPDTGGERDTGVVTAAEIDGWHLHAELVTLSACETALGRNVFGEGTIGFAYPLLRAGSRCLLASRWPVNDEATALLMRRFYENWLLSAGGGRSYMDKADALREARVWLREWRDRDGHRPYRHPYYWASFVLVGR